MRAPDLMENNDQCDFYAPRLAFAAALCYNAVHNSSVILCKGA
jgi:hypothetical protein